jgi:hypothetical protein
MSGIYSGNATLFPYNSPPITTLSAAQVSTLGLQIPPPYSGSPTGFFNNNPALAPGPPNLSTLFQIGSTIVTNPTLSTLGLPDGFNNQQGYWSSFGIGYTTVAGSAVPLSAQ